MTNKKRKIVFITDCCDIAFNELCGTISNYIKNEDEIHIEPVASVEPFSIINGAFSLRLLAEIYPENTIFSIILNPCKIRPERIMGTTIKKNLTFVGANTGVFDWFLKDFGINELYEIKDEGFFPFGGKYVHAPTVAKIANKESFSKLGTPFDKNKLRKLPLEDGIIVHIDNFGLIKFIGKMENTDEGALFDVYLNEKKIGEFIYYKRMMAQDTGKWIIYPSSSLNLIEIGKVRSNGAKEINAKIGDKITFKKLT